MRTQNDSHPSPIGHVLRIGPDGLLVVETEEDPIDPGARCQREDGRPAGVVRDVIGPVKRPLLVVDPQRGPQGDRPDPEDPDDWIGTTLYPR